MSKFDLFQKRLSSVFIRLSDFLQIELKEEIFVIDYKGQSYIIISFERGNSFSIMLNEVSSVINDYENYKHFKISNVKRIGFIPIDGKKGLLGGDSHCDFTFFDEFNFCFVELKLNATSLEFNAIKKNRGVAINQLSKTIDLFDEKLTKNYEDLNLEAYVCTPETYPRNDTAWTSFEVAFLEKYGIPLFEANHKVCN